MKVYKYMFRALCAVAAIALCSSCSSDDDDWTPGEQPGSLVYFDGETPETVEVLEDYDFTLLLTRQDASSTQTVALSSSDTTNFTVPASAFFAEGTKTVRVPVHFKGNDTAGQYSCTVGIADSKFVDPYTTYATSMTVSVVVAKWSLYIENAYFYDNTGYVQPFEANIYKLEGQDVFRIENFAEGVDLTFETRASAWQSYAGYENYETIYPWNGSYGSDPWWSYDAWFFSETPDQDNLYFKNNEGYRFYYPFLFMGDSYCYMDRSQNFGLFTMGFVKYADSSTSDDDYDFYGYIYLSFSWYSEDVKDVK